MWINIRINYTRSPMVATLTFLIRCMKQTDCFFFPLEALALRKNYYGAIPFEDAYICTVASQLLLARRVNALFHNKTSAWNIAITPARFLWFYIVDAARSFNGCVLVAHCHPSMQYNV